ncbi:hypothetical protein C0Q70_01041 [Pomacea canaliculata]|uniref:Uncharacterized protein n=1 Tax=Pomacea canaliculata TaxID=400727 RepID=A0A2T7PYC2_POMCA|nr:hypothetical protein C0Q70_01041 [Pomacea canaliculata]
MHYRKLRCGGGRAPWAGESNQGRQPTGAAGSHGPCICCRARADNSGREYVEGAFRQSGHNPSVTSGDKRRLRRAHSASRSNGSCRCRRGVARSYGTPKRHHRQPEALLKSHLALIVHIDHAAYAGKTS